MKEFYQLAKKVLKQISAWLPPAPSETDWSALAYRWRKQGSQGYLLSVNNISRINLDDLKHIERQKTIIDSNTKQFIEGKPANNVLMTGARGTGKSSLVRSMLGKYYDSGLRLIEIDKSDLVDLPIIVDIINNRTEKYILFCDDLSFEDGEIGYKALKSVLDGSVSAKSDNILIYATSNRRHLVPEYFYENLQLTKDMDGEIHPGETTEEKNSLSERFGLWVSFHPFNQDFYLDIVKYWINEISDRSDKNIDKKDFQNEAISWAIERGSRSGRIAQQFARYWVSKKL
ncbi:putative ATPase of the DUF815 family and AAA+ superfamily [Candidatus Kinetoplastibacterium blastocrithidii TCC012E]|uniref:Putative ATPase of the DUF815 family and AAA+ superfamily n=1 Tax=Candidatus Kinetoplastidibacterium blastocrithidiae TCC012E TaxID=1208922 RepID=M1LAJ6_9PROT|nr:ATP-binding protein [Candidatus Kinetoplastibacterium blastocrithidii]AFZ83422.1 hypothetical protein CKBE_00233 [Candidatus Kinetoplastibacterium blastocrithidii (ex Strigomonas culicis)]AGF49518.1 putative ATPase of the DUF815 family and AAA+ superfamily [Candidatus Kinetoplastibacterium blastocrithidii TCC012E]